MCGERCETAADKCHEDDSHNTEFLSSFALIVGWFRGLQMRRQIHIETELKSSVVVTLNQLDGTPTIRL